jgi:hypothetical protein
LFKAGHKLHHDAALALKAPYRYSTKPLAFFIAAVITQRPSVFPSRSRFHQSSLEVQQPAENAFKLVLRTEAEADTDTYENAECSCSSHYGQMVLVEQSKNKY